jgi:hypothetical protein
MDLAAIFEIDWRIENDLLAILDTRQHFNLPAKITGNGNLFHMDGVILDRCHMQSVLIKDDRVGRHDERWRSARDQKLDRAIGAGG